MRRQRQSINAFQGREMHHQALGHQRTEQRTSDKPNSKKNQEGLSLIKQGKDKVGL
jgi:hypothetical protein